MEFVQFSTPLRDRTRPGAEAEAKSRLAPSDEVRDFVLAANVAAQDATQDPAASAAPERVVSQLAGSSESATYLFAMCASTPLAEVSELGYPLISSTDNPRQCGLRGHAWPGGAPSFAGFVHLTLPLLEDTDVAEIECVLDIELLPLPGEPASAETNEVTTKLVAEAEKIATKLGRTRAQVTLHHAADQPASSDPFYAAISQRGYQKYLAHVQAYTPVTRDRSRELTAPLSPNQPYKVDTWLDYGIPETYASQVRSLLTIASTDVPSGGLELAPIEWTPTRMEQAAQRLRARGGTTLLAALIDQHSDEICALTEVARHLGSDPAVAEWTLTVTARHYRNRGLASGLKALALHAVREHWPTVERVYGSIPEQPGYMRAIYHDLAASELSCSSTWEKPLARC
ncbi:GNAT family acetyltransferase [Corynebacterium sp.]|uniref:GNAT family acetyltransferase n=1 Tax=Corynebacterium sp. TaxID=1720 RepID=UPI0027B96882|nr:GNAT family acetyltransferase [Corynebacterium sp.]